MPSVSVAMTANKSKSAMGILLSAATTCGLPLPQLLAAASSDSFASSLQTAVSNGSLVELPQQAYSLGAVPLSQLITMHNLPSVPNGKGSLTMQAPPTVSAPATNYASDTVLSNGGGESPEKQVLNLLLFVCLSK